MHHMVQIHLTMAANETIEIPTHFDASSIGAQEQTQQPGCTEFEPLVDTKGIELSLIHI